MKKDQKYAGIHNDVNAGMTITAKMIRDAWVFGLIPESQTCEGWTFQGLDALRQQVHAEWDKYGLLVGNLPEELRERHRRIHDAAIAQAREAGWSGESELDDDK